MLFRGVGLRWFLSAGFYRCLDNSQDCMYVDAVFIWFLSMSVSFCVHDKVLFIQYATALYPFRAASTFLETNDLELVWVIFLSVLKGLCVYKVWVAPSWVRRCGFGGGGGG